MLARPLFGIPFWLLTPVLAGTVAGQDAPSIRVTGVPPDLTLPLPVDRSAVLTASVGSPVMQAWLATSKDAKARVMLARVNDDDWQTWRVDLADPAVARVLVDGEAESFRVLAGGFIPGVDPLLESAPIRFRVLAGDNRELHVRTTTSTLCLPQRTSWASPALVQALSLPIRPLEPSPEVMATAGEGRWRFVASADRRELVLELTPAIREAWHAAEVLAVRVGERASFRLRATPRSLDLSGNVASFTLEQRKSVVIPGSRDWLRLSMGDVTAGQVLVTVETAEGTPLIPQRSVKQGEHLALLVGDARYTLTLDKLVNLLIGEDWAAFAVSELLPSERHRIEQLLDRIATAKVGFVREGVEHDGATAAAHLRQKYESAGPKVATLDEFIDKIGSRSWTTGNPYEIQLPDGKRVDAATWLREQARLIQAPTSETAR